MLRITGMKWEVGRDREELPAILAKKLRLPESSIGSWRISRQSLDARDKERIHWVLSLDFSLENEKEELALLKRYKELIPAETAEYVLRLPEADPSALRPVVAGFGPCGIFAALALAERGYRPLVLERGASMEERIRDVDRFWSGGAFDPASNVQFGEGGAGTFSDGKLTTRIKDPRIDFVLRAFVEAGADPAILYQQRPHLGTDGLREIVVGLRERILALGGRVRFRSCLTDLFVEEGKLTAIEVNGKERIPCDALILAPGHSARDTFRLLKEKKLPMEQKPFSMGVRIEHLQEQIDAAQYGEVFAGKRKTMSGDVPGPADYQLSRKTREGRGVYTFCMCPGGQVVAAASQEGGLAVNGMSLKARDGKNANSALLVDVRPEDFGSEDPLAGVLFQEKYERAAYELGGGYKAPVQRLESFMEGREDREDTCPQSPVQPSYRPGVAFAPVEKCLPPFVAASIREAIPQLGKLLKGFDAPDSLLTAIESRSSSPVRILRDKESLSASISGIFPAGEGAGYAGGIVSAAVDGVRAAEALGSKRKEGTACESSSK